ncbi:MAG: sulfatase-like hydrolase/transferase [Paludibacteraceae bacterium]|nr:sulfatase-like hydrolase/transferase [Paludibacteraceae bacterium]MBQ4391415.1 sulfatase-like hydrolase/transferase [Paludibacteraceae bacterium]
MASRLWRHPWVVAVCNLLVVMAIYTLSRLFFFWVNADIFPNVSAAHLGELLLGGLRFDLTAVLYLSALYMVMMVLPLPWRWRTNGVYQTVCKWVLLVPNLIGLAVNCVDMVYIRFTDRRTSMTFFSEFANDNNLGKIFITGVFEYWYVTLFFLIAAAAMIQLTRKADGMRIIRNPWVYYIVETVLLAVSAYFVVIGIRGGFGAYTRPITMSNAMQYTNTPRESAIVLNTPFTLMRSTEGKAYVNPHYYPDDELDKIMSPVHNEPASHKQMKERNVVIFILESFSKEYMGSYTPFLDSLSRVSVSYEYSFASGRKSIDAMPSVLSSIPMLIEPYIVTAYSTNAVSSVADCLKRKGYTTAFFHGAPNGSMGFQAYARSAGFAKYYGMDEYDGPEAFDGTWAIWDEEFLQYYGRTMSTMAEPFCTAVFTASSHHPFRIPERYEGRFPKGEVPIHQCIGYSDNALREFFNYAKKQPWYENTLFVLTADHTNQLTRPESQTAKGVYEVPIIFFDPQVNKGKVKKTPVSQTDIMPSILEYLGYDEPYFAFGENALTKDKKHPYAVCYNTNVYQIMSDHLVMIFDGEQIVGIYDYQEDPLLKANRKDEWSERKEVKDMLTYLKAYIQQYISRMIENRLTVQ